MQALKCCWGWGGVVCTGGEAAPSPTLCCVDLRAWEAPAGSNLQDKPPELSQVSSSWAASPGGAGAGGSASCLALSSSVSSQGFVTVLAKH